MINTDAHGAKSDDIRSILKGIDEGFDIEFDYPSERYFISYNGHLFQRVPYGEVDRKLLNEIRHTFWLNKTDRIFDQVDRENELAEAREERKLRNYVENLADDLMKPLINNYYFGR